MKVVGDVPEVGAYARPLALVEGLSQVAAAFLADSLCGGPFLHSSATTLRGEPAIQVVNFSANCVYQNQFKKEERK